MRMLGSSNGLQWLNHWGCLLILMMDVLTLTKLTTYLIELFPTDSGHFVFCTVVNDSRPIRRWWTGMYTKLQSRQMNCAVLPSDSNRFYNDTSRSLDYYYYFFAFDCAKNSANLSL